MDYLKKILGLSIVLMMYTVGCKKGEISSPSAISINKFATLKTYSKEKLLTTDFENINWEKFNSTILKSGGIVYVFAANENKNKSFIFLTDKEKVLGKMVTMKVESSMLYTDLYDMETGKSFNKIDNLVPSAIAITPTTTTTDPSLLPPVVIVCYTGNTSNLIRFHLSIDIGGGGSGYNWNYVAETGYIANDVPLIDPPLGGVEPVLEFIDANEALAFFAWELQLSAEELAVLAMFPEAAISIYRASQKALAKAQEWAAANLGANNGITNGKADALRHSYWNALMTSDIGSVIANLFSLAHEMGSVRPATMTQSQYDLERQMDLNNNLIGRNFTVANNYGFFTSAETIWNDLTNNAVTPGFGLQYICAAGGPGTETIKDFNATCP